MSTRDSSNALEWPSAQDAIDIARARLGVTAHDARRFPTGIGHHVYELTGTDGRARVVRLGARASHADFAGAVHWSTVLRPIGVPLPQLLAHGFHRDFPYLILERLPGDDLGNVYSNLTPTERAAIAAQVCAVQQRVAGLPMGRGFGYEREPGSPLQDTWGDVVAASMERSRARIREAGLLPMSAMHRLGVAAQALADYFADIRPLPFLDDITTKNVLVHAGRFSGIVDVDCICHGDPLFTIGLTRAALLAAGLGTDYTDAWCALLPPGDMHYDALHFYTALFCADLISESGRTFNGNPKSPDPLRHARLAHWLHWSLDAMA